MLVFEASSSVSFSGSFPVVGKASVINIKTFIEPTLDFSFLLKNITSAQASKETNMTTTLRKAIELFPNEDVTKHLILITDALPTTGKDPEKETLEEASNARSMGITISLIGIDLNEKGRKLAEKLVELGGGKLYVVKNVENIDKVVLEDYYNID